MPFVCNKMALGMMNEKALDFVPMLIISCSLSLSNPFSPMPSRAPPQHANQCLHSPLPSKIALFISLSLPHSLEKVSCFISGMRIESLHKHTHAGTNMSSGHLGGLLLLLSRL